MNEVFITEADFELEYKLKTLELIFKKICAFYGFLGAKEIAIHS